MKFLFSIVLFSITLVVMFYMNSKNSIDTENFALGTATQSHFAKSDNYSIHMNKINNEEWRNTIEESKDKRNKKGVCLILGNSQTHSINQKKTNQTTYVELLHNRSENPYVLAHTIQNVNIQELLLSIQYIQSNLEIEKIILPVFFDDMRENGIRDLFFTKPINEGFRLETTYDTEFITEMNLHIGDFNSASENKGNEIKYLSTQDIVEKQLENVLSNNFKIWADRPKLRGKVFTDLYLLRNSVFNITAQTIRNKIPAIYDKNLMAFKEIIFFSQKNNIELYVYIPPIRNDISIPYNLDDYDDFKNEIRELCQEHKVQFENFEDIVPGKFWGMKSSTSGKNELEYDFMHFQYDGHKILDSVIYNFVF